MAIESVKNLKELLNVQDKDTVLFSTELSSIPYKPVFVVYRSTVDSNQMLYALVLCTRPTLNYLGYTERAQIFNAIKNNPVIKLSLASFYSTQYPGEVKDSHIPFIGFVYESRSEESTDEYTDHEATHINTMSGDKLLVDIGIFLYPNKSTYDEFLKEVTSSTCDESNTFVITNKVKIDNGSMSVMTDEELSVELDTLPIWMDIAKQAYTLCRAYEHDQVRKGNTEIRPKKQWDELSPESRQIVAMSVSKIYKDGVSQSNNAFVRTSLGSKTDVMILFESACEELIAKNIDSILSAGGVNIPKPTQIVEQV